CPSTRRVPWRWLPARRAGPRAACAPPRRALAGHRVQPPPHPKYRYQGGLFQARGCAPYWLAASDEGSNAMGREEHAAVVAWPVDDTPVEAVGGKGAGLGALARIDGICVPPGFCVTTDAFRRVMAQAPSIDDRLDRVSRLSLGDRDAVRE